MDKKQFLESISKIGTTTDDVERRTLLASLQDEVSTVYDSLDTLNTTITTLNDSLKKSNDDLEKAQKANMDLFLRVSTQKTDSQIKDGSTGVEQEPEKSKRKFEDLFK